MIKRKVTLVGHDNVLGVLSNNLTRRTSGWSRVVRELLHYCINFDTFFKIPNYFKINFSWMLCWCQTHIQHAHEAVDTAFITNATLNRNGDSGHLFLLFVTKGKFSPLEMITAKIILYSYLTRLKKFFSNTNFQKVSLNHEWILNFVIYWIDHKILFLHL